MGSLTEQAAEEMGGPLSVLTRQRRDHARLDRMPGQLPQVTGADEDELLNRICRLVFSHAFARSRSCGPRCGGICPTARPGHAASRGGASSGPRRAARDERRLRGRSVRPG